MIKAFDAYLETGKPLESVYRGRGLARSELGQYPGAIEDFTKALELHPTSAVQANRGWTYRVVDSPKLALRDFELAIELDPKNSDAYNGRSFARAKLGRYREPFRTWRKPSGSGRRRPVYTTTQRGRSRSAPVHTTGAVELLRQALSVLPAAGRRTSGTTTSRRTRSSSGLAASRCSPGSNTSCPGANEFMRVRPRATRGTGRSQNRSALWSPDGDWLEDRTLLASNASGQVCHASSIRHARRRVGIALAVQSRRG